MKAKFRLNIAKKTDKKAAIIMRLHFEGNRITISVGEVVNISHWSKSKRRMNKNTQKEPYNYHTQINQKLERYEIKAKQLYYDCAAKDIPFTKLLLLDHLKNRLDEDLNAKKDFLQAFDEYLRYKKNEHTESTAKTYRAAKNKLIDFEKYNNVKMTFDDFNDNFYLDFQNYIFQVKSHQTNYFVNLMKKYRAVLNWSLGKEYHSNLAFNKWKLKETEPQIIYLTFDELNLLYKCKLDIERHIKARDFLIFQCDTGTRISDFKTFSDANFSVKNIIYKNEPISVYWLNYTSVKTKKKVSLPLTKRAVRIYQKYIIEYKRKKFPCFSDQKYNDYIKEVGEIAGINKATEKFYHSGSKHTKDVESKFKLMSSKIGRKTFVSLHYQKNGETKTIMGMTGHMTTKAFDSYCQDSEENKYNYILRIDEETQLN